MSRFHLHPATVYPRVGLPLLGCFLALALLTPSPAAAADSSERELAKAVAAQLTLVAEEGKEFSAAMDALAKARLRIAQSLEENLVVTRESNDLSLRAWKAIGATYRVRLFEEVLAATDEAVSQRQATEKRHRRQERELEELESAVDFRAKALLAAAKDLAKLAKPRSRELPLGYVQRIVSGISADAASGTRRAKLGELLSVAAQARVTVEGLTEEKKAAQRKKAGQ